MGLFKRISDIISANLGELADQYEDPEKMLKQAIRRVYPGFNESYYGYRSFTDLLKEGERRGYFDLEYDEGRGNYMVRLRGD